MLANAWDILDASGAEKLKKYRAQIIENKTKRTERQKEVYEFIKLFIGRYKYPPTRAQIALGFGWKSANAAQQNLEALERKGWIKLVRNGVSRGIVVL